MMQEDVADINREVLGPKPIFLLGNALDLLKGKNQCAYDALRLLSEKYGEFFKIKLPPNRTVYISSNSKHLREVMVSRKDEFPKGDTVSEIKSLDIGASGLLVVEGDEWVRQRSIAKPAFKNVALKEYFETYSRNANKALKLLSSGEPFDIFDLSNRLTLSITCETSFSYTPSSLENMLTIEDPLVKRLNLIFEQLLIRNQRSALWKHLPIPSNFRVKRASKALNKFFSDIIESRRVGGEKQYNDLLSLMMESTNEDESSFNDVELIDQMFVVLAGGQDSTSTALAWLICYLAQNPAVERRVVDEVASVVGSADTVDYEMYQKLGYLHQVACETLRLRPSFPILFRAIPENTTLDGYELEAGSWITFLLPELQRRKDIWGDLGDEFNPENFSPDNRKQRAKDAYVPFGLGPRMCIGNQMAMMELVTVAALFIKNYRYEMSPNQNLDPYLKFSWGVKSGVKLSPIRR